MAYLLKYKYGQEALACSLEKNTPETLGMLGRWADKVIWMAKDLWEQTGQPRTVKDCLYDVGPDVWCNSFHPDLLAKLERLVKEKGEFF